MGSEMCIRDSSNRAACFSEMGEARRCAEDCDEALAALKPHAAAVDDSTRALAFKIRLRRAEARRRLGRLGDAKEDAAALVAMAGSEDEKAAADYVALQLEMICVE